MIKLFFKTFLIFLGVLILLLFIIMIIPLTYMYNNDLRIERFNSPELISKMFINSLKEKNKDNLDFFQCRSPDDWDYGNEFKSKLNTFFNEYKDFDWTQSNFKINGFESSLEYKKNDLINRYSIYIKKQPPSIWELKSKKGYCFYLEGVNKELLN